MTPLVLRVAAPLLAGVLASYMGGCPTNEPAAVEQASKKAPAPDEYTGRRERMVRDQLRGRDITDRRVLAAMLRVPRHLFVPPDILPYAYEDSAVRLALGQTVSQPYIVAYMTQALALKGGERVLEIGTGSGYQAAVLAEIAREVYTMEILPDLSRRAQEVLAPLGYGNIRFRIGDGYQGWPDAAPFDSIMVTAAPDHVPQPLVEQLKLGGRMIIPVGRFEQDLLLIEKTQRGVVRKSTIPVRFVPMTGKAEQGPP